VSGKFFVRKPPHLLTVLSSLPGQLLCLSNQIFANIAVLLEALVVSEKSYKSIIMREWIIWEFYNDHTGTASHAKNFNQNSSPQRKF
jgi:hypothetical protein